MTQTCRFESLDQGLVPVGLLHTPGGRGRLASSLCGQLLPGGFASSGLTGSLLGKSHSDVSVLLMQSGSVNASYIHMWDASRVLYCMSLFGFI